MRPDQQGLMGGYGNDGRGGYGPPGDGGYGGYGPTGGNPGGYGPSDQGGYGNPGGYGGNPGGYAPTGQGGGGYEQGADYGGDTKAQGNRQWKNGWFLATFLMMVASLFGLIVCIGSGQIVDAIEFFYLFLFSLVVVVDNMPVKNNDFVKRWRYSIGIYVQALRRMTFLGLFLVFIGSSLIGAFCNNDTGGFLTAIGGIAGGIGVLAGLLSIIFGVRQSHNLEKLRAQFDADAQYGRLDNDFRTYSKGKQFLTPQEFVDFSHAKGGMLWDPHYNMLIFNALSWDPNKITLSQDAFMAWVRSPPSCLPTLL